MLVFFLVFIAFVIFFFGVGMVLGLLFMGSLAIQSKSMNKRKQ